MTDETTTTPPPPPRPMGERNQGRKALAKEGGAAVIHTIRLTPEQKQKLVGLGGGKWIRTMLDKA